MKKKLLDLLAKKEQRKAELGTKAGATENVEELRGINTELEALNADIAELRGMIDAMPDDEAGGTATGEEEGLEARSAAQPVGAAQVLATYGVGGGQKPGQSEDRSAELKEKYEKRGAELKNKKAVEFEIDEFPEFRAVTIGGGTLINEKKYSSTMNQSFNEVSSVVDLVNAVPLLGGESYEKGFEVSNGEGDYSTETGNYTETDPVFGYVSIGKAKITAYTEMSDEAMKLPNINYQALVAKHVGVSLRKKITKQILVGAGGANAVTGIFNAPASVIPDASDITIAEIDAETLDKIVFGYGGDEDVEGGAYLILSKRDLAAFADIRDANGQKLYKIKLNGNFGTISSSESYEVPFVINSACPVLSADATASATYCMAYGILKGYELPIFSPVTVEESRDYKFRTGQIAYRGSVWVGGNVAMYKGFIRVKKA